MKVIEGRLDASDRKIGIVVSRWNELVTNALLDGALDTLRTCGDPDVIVVRVPGSWEIPLAARGLIDRQGVHGVVALGCILQGETPHARLLASDVGSALMALQNETGVPISWGVLTPDSADQALDRAGLKHGNKGREAALSTIEMVSLLSHI